MKRWNVPLLCLFGWLCVAPQMARAQDFSYDNPLRDIPLGAENYKRLNQFQRSAYDKAIRLAVEKQYKAASVEFEKIKLEFEMELDADLLAYFYYAQARCLHANKDRNHAIRVYTEVLDYFKDESWVAAQALYYRGIAHFDNGAQRQGLKDMKTLVEEPAYQTQAVAAGALRRLADNHFKNTEVPQAIKYWKQAWRDFEKSNPNEAAAARNNAIGVNIRDQKFGELQSWLLPADKGNDPAVRMGLANTVHDVAMQAFVGDWGKYIGPVNQPLKIKDMSAYFGWWKAQRPFYEQGKKLWDWYSRALDFIHHRYGDEKERNALTDEMVAFIKSPAIEEGARTGCFIHVIDRTPDYTKALVVADMIPDRLEGLWKKFEITGHRQGKWQESMVFLDQLIESKNDSWAKRAKWEKAGVYRDRLGKHAEAIKLYEELNEPPRTLWEIQRAQRMSGKISEAHATLTTIGAMFPDEKPAAAYQRAEYHREDGQREDAVGLYRQILKAFPKSSQSSQAHQRLEDLGIETGGGVIDEN